MLSTRIYCFNTGYLLNGINHSPLKAEAGKEITIIKEFLQNKSLTWKTVYLVTYEQKGSNKR